MSEITLGLIGLCILLLVFATGIEMGFAMIVVGFVGFAITNSLNSAMNLLARDLFEATSSYGFIVFPMFMFMGQIGFHAGIASQLFDTANKWIGQ